MAKKSIVCLLVEDSPTDAFFLKKQLATSELANFNLVVAERLSEGLGRLASEGANVVLLDLDLPDCTGLETLAKMIDEYPDLPIIVLTGLKDENVALEAVHKGAQDYLIKGQIDEAILSRSIHYAIERKSTEVKLRESERKNRDLFETSEKRLQQTIALRNIDRAIANSMDLRFTLEVVLDQVFAELKADAVDILLYNNISHTLEFFVGKGFHTQAVEGALVPLGGGYAGQSVLDRKPMYLSLLGDSKTQFHESRQFHLEEFAEYFCMPLIAKGKILGALEIFNRSQRNVSEEWKNFFETLAGQAAIAIENTTLFEELQRANADLILGYDATIEGWSRALDLRDKETKGHTQRVARLTIDLARRMNVPEETLIHIRRGALLHDIGKMGVPDSILLKPGPLTDQEWVIMKKHPVYAREMLEPIAYLRPALEIPVFHHEKWDGSGYPDGLSGLAIPLSARLFSVADVYDALTSERPYRTAWTKTKALDYIRDEAGKHFDPQVVDAFLGLDLSQY